MGKDSLALRFGLLVRWEVKFSTKALNEAFKMDNRFFSGGTLGYTLDH
jgi:hypothetical protein